MVYVLVLAADYHTRLAKIMSGKDQVEEVRKDLEKDADSDSEFEWSGSDISSDISDELMGCSKLTEIFEGDDGDGDVFTGFTREDLTKKD